MTAMLARIWEISLELAPWLLLGTVVAGVLQVVLPPNWLARQLGGRLGVVKAVLLGVPLPLCSCGVIPVGLSLRQSGASRGSVVGFLVSTPQTGVDSILVSAGMLGWPFAIFKVVSAAVTGLIAGWFVDVADPSVPPLPIAGTDSREQPRGSATAEFLGHVDMLLRSIWHWLVVGVVFSALLSSYLPTDGLDWIAGYGALPAMLLMLAISLPLYVCATASVPIAAALVAAGVPVGAALVFLMAGPATNIATVGAVYKTLGRRSLIIYLLTIIVGSIAGGLLFESLVATSGVDHLHNHESFYWLRAASAVALIALFAYYGATDLVAWRQRLLTKRAAADEKRVEVDVAGMTCQGCVSKLTQTLRSDPRARLVSVELSPGHATVVGDLAADDVIRLVEQAGFRVPCNAG